MIPTQVGERLLVVDASTETRELLQRNLSSEGYRVLTASGVDEAVRLLQASPVDLVLTELDLPGTSGLDLVRHVRENLRETVVLVITGHPSIEGAIEAVKLGAEDYLPKPFSQEALLIAARRALQKLQMRRVGRVPAERSAVPLGLVGESAAMRGVFKSVQKAAGTSATVLITGESGTGKELVARAIHYRGPRAAAPFVPVNCGGIPLELLESELFGHMKGAFTGASDTRAGFFQTAEGGTIFLDEVSETTHSMQVKLLRVLQDKEVCMVGSTRPRAVDVRVIAATNKNLDGLVEKGVFRDDLYYRLNVITIAIPPLRDRGEDVLLLTRYFTRKFAREYGRSEPELSERALSVLRHYPWPGNVRELENIIQRMIVMADGELLDVPDLPAMMRFSALREPALNRPLEEVEGEYIRSVLQSVGGNKTRASQILGIDRKTLREKLKK
jgi:DNA-binding NtrC family response regulator